MKKKSIACGFSSFFTLSFNTHHILLISHQLFYNSIKDLQRYNNTANKHVITLKKHPAYGYGNSAQVV